MTSPDKEFLRMLRATFKVEAAEHVQEIDEGMRALEQGGDAAERSALIEKIYRAAHSLKGAARSVDFTEVESVCQTLEDIFAGWKRGETQPDATSLDYTREALDRISEVISAPAGPERAPEERRSPPSASPMTARAPEMPSADAAIASGAPALTATPANPAAAMPAAAEAAPPRASRTSGKSAAGSASTHATEADTVRVAVSMLDARLLEAEELLAAKLAASQRVADIGALASQFEHWQKEWARIQPYARSMRRTAVTPASQIPEAATPGAADISAVADFFEWTHDYLRSLEGRVASLRRSAEQDQLLVSRLVDDLLENSKKLLMLPLTTLSALLRKVVRDLCRDQGKEAELVIHGEDVKVDKRILEEMKDPLVHILRNAIDHGVEPPEVRRLAGKPERATIEIAVAQTDGSHVEIRVSDDGTGIDVGKVKASAVKRGLLTSEAAAALSAPAAMALAFEADVSTSPMITHVSGRGLGLAIVREKAQKLGGQVAIEARPGGGTVIRTTLPITLATFRGVLVECSRRLFVVPSAQVERVTRFRTQEVLTVEGRETIPVNGRALALAALADVLDLPQSPDGWHGEQGRTTPAVILGTGEQRMALAVDAVIGEREVLVKPLRKPLSRVRHIAGATVLGSGEVVPILNVTDVLRTARHTVARSRPVADAVPPHKPKRRVLVAEDSITSRMLLKGILESAGYEVKTASDGMEAFTSLRAEHFDIVVSDVEMPRLNGFDLTARIRADRQLAELPVVLVTALESREHRERGIDVGANAYLVKSGLDQGELLAALRRLA